jgi:hypothetical protein
MATAISIAIVLWLGPLWWTSPVETKPFVLGKVMSIAPIACTQAWECVFDVTGVESVLGRSVLVHIRGIRAPEWGSACPEEDELGERATTFMFELLATADNVTLVRPYKIEGDPAIVGMILVDGIDVVTKMINLGAAIAPGVRVNWCKPPRKYEV